MSFSLVVAMDRRGVIGVDNGLPWRLSDDLRYFKRVTTGKPVVMGRRTFESIGRALPERRNVVLTRDSSWQHADCESCASVAAMQALLGAEQEVMIIGGGEIYALTLALCARMHITHVDTEIDGDTWFPEVDWAAWRAQPVARFEAGERNSHAFSIVVYERLRQPRLR